MVREDMLVVHDGFYWPGERLDSIQVRRNTDDASRSVDSISLEELAFAAHLVLEAGTRMQRDDLILEVTRLYEYQRIGSKIESRIDDAVALLVSEDCAEAHEDGSEIRYVDVDATERLLDRVYR